MQTSQSASTDKDRFFFQVPGTPTLPSFFAKVLI
jgi:hypothetical protein